MRLFLIAVALACVGCVLGNSQARQSAASIQQQGVRMNITMNGKTFTATLADTTAAAEFAQMLPLTLDMNDYNRNEKVAPLSRSLSAADQAVERIETGDILLWQGNSLVVFYESFDTPYRYTRIGKITNTADLKDKVGTRNVSVRFERREPGR